MMEMHISPRQCRTLMLVLCVVALTACGLAKPMPPFDSFAHRISDGTLFLYWNCSRPAPGAVRVEGWANNPDSPQPIKDLEFILYGVNAQESTVSQAKASAQAYLIQTNEPTTFAIDLKTVGAEVRYDLVYEYWGAGDSGMGFRGGGGGSPRQQNMARDVCAGLTP
jgi:hypothetical protein